MMGGNAKQCAAMYVDKVYLCLHIGWPESERPENAKGKLTEHADGEGFADIFTDLVDIPDGAADWEQGLEWAGLT